MAQVVNAGTINFNIEANTKSLKRVFTQLEKLKTLTDKATSSQVKGSSKVAAQLLKQEDRLRGAIEKTIKLRDAMLKAGTPAAEYAKVTSALSRLSRALTRGEIDNVKLSRAVAKFNHVASTQSRVINNVAASTDKAAIKTARWKNNLRQMESATVLAIGPLSGLGARVRSFGAILNRTTFFIAAAISTSVLLSVGFFKLGKSAIDAARIFESANARFLASSGSLQVAGAQMAFVVRESQRLGLRIEDTTKSFSRLVAATRGSGLSMKQVRLIFTGVAEAAAALRLTGAEVEGTFRALEQIMSKGSVQAEELRGQLGERLPGAFKIAADAMKVTTARLGEMLKAGELTATEFAPLFAAALSKAFGKEALKNIDSLTGSSNKLDNSWLLLSKTIDDTTHASKVYAFALQSVALGLDAARRGLLKITGELDAYNEATAEAILASEAMEAAFVGSKAFRRFADDIRDVERDIKAASFGKFADQFVDAFDAFETIKDFKPNAIRELSKLLGITLTDDVNEVANAFGRASQEARDLATTETDIEKLDKVMAKLAETTATAESKFVDLLGGTRSKEFSAVDAKIRAIAFSIRKLGPLTAEQAGKLTELAIILRKVFNIQQEQIQATKDANKTQALRIRLLTQAITLEIRQNTFITKTTGRLKLLRKQIEAIGKGPDFLENFLAIEVPLQRINESMIALKMHPDDITAQLKLWRAGLEDLKKAQDGMSMAARISANATVNALEDVIFTTKSASEAFKEMIRLIIKAIFRAAILDPLIKSLTGVFTDLFKIGGTNIAAPIIDSRALSGEAHGGAWKVGGHGGRDSQLVAFRASPSETVTVSTPGQHGTGGLTIIINADNADAGTIARIRQIVRDELAPQIIREGTRNTIAVQSRPRFGG